MAHNATIYGTAEDGNTELLGLLRNGLVDDAKGLMTENSIKAGSAIREYDTRTHAIMTDPRRRDKVVDKGDKRKIVTRSRLPIPYQQYINEMSVVFLYGRPVKWNCTTDDTKDAFAAFKRLIKRTRFDSKIRQCKRIAGSETESALLFRVFKNDEGKADCQARVLANSKGDTMYTLFDIYENLLSFGWEYSSSTNGEIIRHFNVYTAGITFYCTNAGNGWSVSEEKNLVGKIPVILFRQKTEWDGVEHLIEREEYIISRTADTNDYFSDPHLIISADLKSSLSDKDVENKTMSVKSEKGVSDMAKYLTWDSAPESKKWEIEQLRKHILTKSFTPDVDFEQMKGLSNISGKALKQMMLLADIKASRHKETHDELLDRTASLLTSIIANVLDIALKPQCDKMEIEHEFQEPFGEDITEMISNLVKSKDGGIISAQGAIERNPLIKNSEAELARVEEEKEKAIKAQQDLFNNQY